MSSFTHSVPVNSVLKGTGPATQGLLVRVVDAQPIGAPALTGPFEMMASGEEQLATHFADTVAHNAYQRLRAALPPEGGTTSFEAAHAALVAAVGCDPEHMEVINTNLLHRSQWELVGPCSDGCPCTACSGPEPDLAADRLSIASMAAVPTHEERAELYAKSREAEAARAAGQRGPLLSKAHTLPPKVGLLPADLNPDHTILAKLGRGDIGPGGSAGIKQILTLIPDREAPFTTSCGPNGVLTDCQCAFGANRLNLFYQNAAETKRLLDTYLSMRDANGVAVFKMYHKAIQAHAVANETDTAYRDVASLFRALDERVGVFRHRTLDSAGLGLVSFCQTWWRKGLGVGDAQFSVASPHFQTRLYVKDEAAFRKCLADGGPSGMGGQTTAWIEKHLAAYTRVVQRFDEAMAQDYGVAGGGQAFVNMDALCQELADEQANPWRKYFGPPADGEQANPWRKYFGPPADGASQPKQDDD